MLFLLLFILISFIFIHIDVVGRITIYWIKYPTRSKHIRIFAFKWLRLRKWNALSCFTDSVAIMRNQVSYCMPCTRLIFIRPFGKTDVLCHGNVRPSLRPSVRPSVRPGFPDFSSTCFEISIWNLVYTFSRWHNMSSLSCITIGSLWPSLQPKVGQTHFWQSWPHKSR